MNIFKQKTTVILVFILSVLLLGAAPSRHLDTNSVSLPKAEVYTRVIVKLDVPNLETLTFESTKYKAIRPGETFPQAGYEADLNLKTAIANVADAVLYQLNGKGYIVNRRYSVIPYLALSVSTDARSILESLKEVEGIKESKSYKVGDLDMYTEQEKSAVSSSGNPGVSSPKLDNTVNIVGASDAWTMGFTGEGYYVAMLDTGIRNDHLFFEGKDIVEKCYSILSHCPNGSTEDEGEGSAAHHANNFAAWDHGTWVTGVAAGHRANDTLNGVAKNANIIAVQVCSHYNDCSFIGYPAPCVAENEEDVLSGLEYVYSLRGEYPIAAVNMSIGDQQQHGAVCDADQNWGIISAIVTNLKNVGIASVAASGNDGFCNGINAPGCISDVISVGGSTDADNEWQFNNWHSTLLNLFAPCDQINTSIGTGNNQYNTVISGTSLAVPHVVGAFALMKQACPDADVDDLLTALETTGEDVFPIGCGQQPATPRIQIDDAIDSLNDSITVTSPNTGYSYPRGYRLPIAWTTCGIGGNVMLCALADTLSYLIETSHPFDGSPYEWTIPNDFPYGRCRIQVGQGGLIDYSSYFRVGNIDVTYPDAGHAFGRGVTIPIQWNTDGLIGNVMIVGETNFASYLIETAHPYNASPYNWTIPANFPYGTCRIRIIQDFVEDYSSDFIIGDIDVLEPHEGQLVHPGANLSIEWIPYGITGNVMIVAESNSTSYIVTTSYPADRSPYIWSIPGTFPTGTCKIRIFQDQVNGYSDKFEIQ